MNDVDPEQEERVRALLAADPVAPIPADVAARLDETLAGLVAEREAGQLSQEHTATGEVVPLRPRWMPRIAAGAAAVIVLGLGGITLAANLGGTQDSTESATSTTGDDAGGRSLLEDSASGAPVESAPGDTAARQKAAQDGLPRLQAASFPRDVQSLLGREGALQRREASAADASCPGPAITDGSQTRLISLDGTAAVLVLRPHGRGPQPVEAWSCDGSRRLASTTVTP